MEKFFLQTKSVWLGFARGLLPYTIEVYRKRTIFRLGRASGFLSVIEELSKRVHMKLIAVAGARPNFMKIAPLVHEIREKHDEIDLCIVHTGQHYDFEMSKVFFDGFDQLI